MVVSSWGDKNLCLLDYSQIACLGVIACSLLTVYPSETFNLSAPQCSCSLCSLLSPLTGKLDTPFSACSSLVYLSDRRWLKYHHMTCLQLELSTTHCRIADCIFETPMTKIHSRFCCTGSFLTICASLSV